MGRHEAGGATRRHDVTTKTGRSHTDSHSASRRGSDEIGRAIEKEGPWLPFTQSVRGPIGTIGTCEIGVGRREG